MAGAAVAPARFPLDVVDSGGASFSDRYAVGNKLGDGGTASVWLAVNRTTGEEVACKIVSRRTGMKWSRATRIFEHEVEMLSLCKHAHSEPLRSGVQGLCTCAHIEDVCVFLWHSR